MHTTPEYPLPLGRFVRMTTLLVIAMFIAMPIVTYYLMPQGQPEGPLMMALMGILICVVTYFFAPKAVSLQQGLLLVYYPFHKRTYNIAGAEVEEVNKDDIWLSMRVMGNGGLFAITGKFRNKALGEFRYHSRTRKGGTLFCMTDDQKVIIGLPYTGAWKQSVERAVKVSTRRR